MHDKLQFITKKPAVSGGLSILMVAFTVQFLAHNDHHRHNHSLKSRQQRRADVIADQTKYRRHNQTSKISTGHLHTDQCLGVFGTEMFRCGVDHAGLNGRAAQTNQNQTHL